jgi:hypothetical protein
MKRACVLFLAAMAVLLMGTTAMAKPGEIGGDVTEAVAISGPGLSRPVGLDQAAVTSYMDLSNVFDPYTRMHVRPSSVALGPRFALLFTMTCTGPAGLKTASIQQDLYPYASFKGQPQVWTFTPSAQRTCGQFVSVAPGWNAARRGLFDTLTTAGLPVTAPVSAQINIPGRLPVAEPERFWPVFGVAAGLMTLLLVSTLVGSPRRRVRSPADQGLRRT